MTNRQKHINDLDELLPNEDEEAIISEALARIQAPLPDVNEAWRRLDATIDSDVHPRSRMLRWTTTALLAAAVCAGLIFLLRPKSSSTIAGRTVISYEEQPDTAVTITKNSQVAAIDRSTVTFSSAQKDNSGSATCSMVALKTPRGKCCNLTLADGTRVWLNAESVLEFPEQFNGKTRTVSLTGEAYFEVAKDARHPFVVKSPYYTVTVLGTSFNAKAYSKQSAEIALVEGRVSVCGKDDRHGVVLHPGNLITFTEGHGHSLKNIDTYPYTQRKSGLFYYDNTSLLDIMLDLARWYNKTVVFENDRSMSMRLHFVAERKDGIADVLHDLGELAGVEISANEREIVIR